MPTSVAIDPRTNIAVLLLSGSSRIALVDLATNERCATVDIGQGRRPERVAFNPETGIVVVTNNINDSISVMKVPAIQCSMMASLSEQTPPTISIQSGSRPLGVAINTQTNTAVVANSGSDTVSVIDLDRNSVGYIRVGQSPQNVAIDSVLNRAYVTHSGIPSLSVIDLGARSVHAMGLSKVPTALAINEVTQQAVVVYGQSNEVSVLALESERELQPLIRVGIHPIDVAINPQRNVALVINSGDNTLTEIDLTTLKAKEPARTLPNPTAIAINPLTNSGIILHATRRTKGRAGVLEQEDAGGDSYSEPSQGAVFYFPRYKSQGQGPGNENTSFVFVNLSGAPASIRLTAVDARGRTISSQSFKNPSVLALARGAWDAKFGSQLFEGMSEDGWVVATSSNPDIKGFFLSEKGDFSVSVNGADERGSLLSRAIAPALGQATELNLVNPHDKVAEADIEHWDIQGVFTSRCHVEIGPNGMRSLPDGSGTCSEVTSSSSGYLRVKSENPLRVYEQFGSRDGAQAALNGQNSSLGRKVLYFPHFVQGLFGFNTSVNVINLKDDPQTVTIKVYNDITRTPTTLTPRLEPRGKLEVPLAQLGIPVGAGWVQVEGERNNSLTGYVTFGTAQALAAVPVQRQAQTVLTFSYAAEGNFSGVGVLTGIALLNPNLDRTRIKIRAVGTRADGTAVDRSDERLTLESNERIVLRLRELIPGLEDLQSGYIVVSADLDIYGLELFGINQLWAAVPAQ